MLVIKLDAVDSTNNYLKQLSRETEVENYTVVLAETQTKGRGQMGTQWTSEKGKNLIFSILAKDISTENLTIFDLNVTIALATAKTILSYNIPTVKIKWPNDILAESKKVGGVLIENALKADGKLVTIIGIGLNLNQTNFDDLPQASSLRLITNQSYDVYEVATALAENIKTYLQSLPDSAQEYWNEYHDLLFKKNEICVFENQKGIRFNGIIKRVTRDGKLAVLLENDETAYFDLKEIKMLY
jgi:BirA family biotin operon repressor/biotin-[acetyl-CoA-carboxylase] ligase